MKLTIIWEPADENEDDDPMYEDDKDIDIYVMIDEV